MIRMLGSDRDYSDSILSALYARHTLYGKMQDQQCDTLGNVLGNGFEMTARRKRRLILYILTQTPSLHTRNEAKAYLHFLSRLRVAYMYSVGALM